MSTFGIEDLQGRERIVGTAISPGAAASTVLTADGAGGTSWAAGGGSQPALPIAILSGATVDTTTYDDPVLDDGTKMRTLLLPAVATALGVAVSGDAHPRVLLLGDPVSYIVLGNGTIDAYNGSPDGCFIGINQNGDGSLSLSISGTHGGFTSGLQDTNRGNLNHSDNALQLGPGAAPAISGGAGAPTLGGAVNDVYFRSDAPDVTHWMYRCTVAGVSGAATWAAVGGLT